MACKTGQKMSIFEPSKVGLKRERGEPVHDNLIDHVKMVNHTASASFLSSFLFLALPFTIHMMDGSLRVFG